MRKRAASVAVGLIAAIAAWVPSGQARAAGEFEISGSSSCDGDGMHVQLDIKNVSGSTQSVFVQKHTVPGGWTSIQYTMSNNATVSPAFDVPHYYQVTFEVYWGTSASDPLVQEYGPRTSTGADNCDIPVPPVRDDIEFDVSAQCSDSTADYEVDVQSLGADKIEVTWVDGNGVPHYSTVGSGDVPVQFSTDVGDIVKVTGEDLWGRLLYDSGYLITDGTGCLREAIHNLVTSIELRCSQAGDDFVLALEISNEGDFDEFFGWSWEAGPDSDSYGPGSVQSGQLVTELVPLAAGVEFYAEINDGDGFSPQQLAVLEGAADLETCNDGGSGGVITTSGSTPPLKLAVLLLSAGVVLTFVGRRRAAIGH